ncbi:molybdate ABC transporter substrate-binding protein [Oscillibacter sp.]|uniref:molybdate ABC transporter substrate-binding protein n=1 Tax=Oscillibacter sp. TaxID=1945593 RepID=UPI002D80BF11|nr:molybdate ABC transporter substrate-binding protein [Oscillibacter sp.]
MKRLLPLLLALLLLTACGGSGDTELTIFAAASMQETLTEIGENYKKEHPDVTLVFNFDSSGTLKTQIQEGAECDIFISAGQKQMDQLDAAVASAVNADAPDKNAEESLDFIESNTRFDLLENKVALAVPEGNPAGIHSYEDLKAALEAGDILLAIGNEDVPVGQYTQKIFTYCGLDETALNAAGVLTYGSNVKEVATQVSEGTVDCGIIYATDAFSAGLTVADTAAADMCGQVIYPAAALKNSNYPKEAQAFLDYLRTPEAGTVLEAVGFTPLG